MPRKAWLIVIVGAVFGAAAGLYLLLPYRERGPLPEESAAVLGNPVLVMGLDIRDGLGSLQDMLYFGGLVTPDGAGTEFQTGKRQIERVLKEVETRSAVKLGRDLEYAVLALFEVGGREPEGVAALVGHFDAVQVFKAVEDAARENHLSGATREVHGTRVLSFADGEGAFAVPNHRTVLVGSQKNVERALARSAPGATDGRPSALALVRGTRSGNRFWLAADHRLFDAVGQQILRGVESPGFPLPTGLVVVESPHSGLEVSAHLADTEAAHKAAQAIRDRLAGAKLEGIEVRETEPFLELRTDRNVVRIRITRSLLTGTASLGVVAAIAIPALLRARVNANEAAAIADVRTVISAQAAYESVAGGYGEMRCLGEPQSCLPGYQGPNFIDPGLASLAVRNGYQRSFYPGPPGAKPGTFQSYAYAASPVTPDRTGTRSFCGNEAGVICQRMGGQPIAAEGGRCPSDCQPLY